MSIYRVGAIALSLVLSGTGLSQTLRMYGPGGPLAPFKECAAVFSYKENVKVEVVAGPEEQWWPEAQGDADIIYGGAEYMLTQFDQKHPGFLAAGTRSELYPRAVGILVRRNNPKHLRTLSDLARPGVAILDVNGAGQLGLWEDLAGRKNLIGPLQRNIAVSAKNSAEGIRLWNSKPELDAWITYESWHNRLEKETTLVRLPASERIYRGTPLAITSRSQMKKEAQGFITFLETPQAHAIFVKWGWK